MRLLLDTHVLIWWDEDASLSQRARRAIAEANEVYVSAVSAWEVAIKSSIGRIRTTRTVAEAAADSGFLELPVTFVHAERVGKLPFHHRDPFDRLLVAQAQAEHLTLVTRDRSFARYRIPLLAA